jgi:osmotically-inducible protein OsmY
MSTASLTDSDLHVREAVMHELDWDPAVDASAIGAAAKAGAVTLTGYIGTYAGKLAAERAAKRVRGVRAVANDIEVRLKLDRTDADIAQDAQRALDLFSTVPATVQAAVHQGHVTLTGGVNWIYQKFDAERAIRHIRGVRSIRNHIVVTPRAALQDVRKRIVKVLHQNANVDARRISVVLAGSTVTLTGTVGTWRDREAAERAAANAPGVTAVLNEIQVEPVHGSVDDVELC